MHELGYKLGLGHDFNPISPSIARVRPESYQRKPHRIDIESLSRLVGCTETELSEYGSWELSHIIPKH